MKKYILKKDLPTFKAGEEFILNEMGHLVSNQIQPSRLVAYSRDTLEKFPNILEDWFEEVAEKPKTVWDLQEGDECWVIEMAAYGPVAKKAYWHKRLEGLRSLGLILLMEEEAKKDISRRLAKQVLLRDTKGFKPDWSKGNRKTKKFLVAWDIDPACLIVDYTNVYIENRIHFATREDALASIEMHEKEWKIYLGVED